jgi:hypothetical protein
MVEEEKDELKENETQNLFEWGPQSSHAISDGTIVEFFLSDVLCDDSGIANWMSPNNFLLFCGRKIPIVGVQVGHVCYWALRHPQYLSR